MNNRVNSVEPSNGYRIVRGNTEPTVVGNSDGGVTTGVKRQTAVRLGCVGNDVCYPRHPERVVIQSDPYGDVGTLAEMTKAPGADVSGQQVTAMEFYLISHITIETKEIEQASGDLLDDKYQDGNTNLLN